MKCLLNYFAMNRQSGEKGKEEAGRNKKRREEGERARGKRWKKIESESKHSGSASERRDCDCSSN